MSVGSPGPSAKEFCALKKPGARAKVVTPCPKPEEPEGADGAPFGGGTLSSQTSQKLTQGRLQDSSPSHLLAWGSP